MELLTPHQSLQNWNVSLLLSEFAEAFPEKPAVHIPGKGTLSFSKLEGETRRWALEFERLGLKNGVRVATFVRPGFNFVPAIFAMYRLGAVPVFIDPGMTLKNMLACVQESKCEAMVGIPLAFLLKTFKPKYFQSIQTAICISNSTFWKKLFKTLFFIKPVSEETAVDLVDVELRSVRANKDQLASILFTSGSTGVPKGVEVTFGILWGQQKILREAFDIKEDEVDMTPFPLFALFSAAWGITCVVPDMNPAKPSQCSGKKLAKTMLDYGVTHTAGSPAIWANVLKYAQKENITFPDLQRILMAGAPVSEKIIRGWRRILPESGHVYTPYGATEALPVSMIRDVELINECYALTNKGRGTCVGKPMGDVRIKIVPIEDGPMDHIDSVPTLKPYEIGEVVVQGTLVTKKYFHRARATDLAKINDWDKSTPGFWHRMGDVGYLDDQGRLWFCGRKDHRVPLATGKTLYPVQVEPLFNQMVGVRRTALVGVSSSHESVLSIVGKKPVLMVEVEPSELKMSKDQLKTRLLQLAQSDVLTKEIHEVLFVKEFPTDVRHNIKINRPLLAEIAQRELQI
ncbi:MAG: AMP-binding protein [Bdellovibrionales bacterium]|nr:AMP-binding protein [Bdellovibrionales bacterium]